MTTLTLKNEKAALARIKLEAHERKIRLKPAPEPPPRTKPAQTPAPSASASAVADNKKLRNPLPQRPVEWGVTLDLDASGRQTRMEQLQAAITAGEAVPAEPKNTRALRVAAAVVKAAPSWPIGHLMRELKNADKLGLSQALYHAAFGLRAGRFTDVFEKSIAFLSAFDEIEKGLNCDAHRQFRRSP